jgi:hypothetical protein
VFVIVFRLAGQSRDYVISKATEENELARSKLRDIKNTRGGLPLDMSPPNVLIAGPAQKFAWIPAKNMRE